MNGKFYPCIHLICKKNKLIIKKKRKQLCQINFKQSMKQQLNFPQGPLLVFIVEKNLRGRFQFPKAIQTWIFKS